MTPIRHDNLVRILEEEHARLAEKDAALVVMLSKLWDEFVDEVRKESGLYEQLNFLGSVAWHKACFDRALANLHESAKHAAKDSIKML